MIMEEALGARVVEGVREATELSVRAPPAPPTTPRTPPRSESPVRRRPVRARPTGSPRDSPRDARAAQVGDFDGCRFKLVCAPEALSVVTMHVDLPCWRELSSLGGQAALDDVFAGLVAAPDPGYKVAVRVDCDAVAAADRPALLAKLIDIKRHLVGAPFADAFAKLAAGTATKGPVAALPWREGGEAVYVMAGASRRVPPSFRFRRASFPFAPRTLRRPRRPPQATTRRSPRATTASPSSTPSTSPRRRTAPWAACCSSSSRRRACQARRR